MRGAGHFTEILHCDGDDDDATQPLIPTMGLLSSKNLQALRACQALTSFEGPAGNFARYWREGPPSVILTHA